MRVVYSTHYTSAKFFFYYWIIFRLVVINEGKRNVLFPIEQALSQRVQGIKDSSDPP